jgi:TolA-binding protein
MMIGTVLCHRLPTAKRSGSCTRVSVFIALAAMTLAGCVAEEEDGVSGQEVSGLQLSLTDYRFGTQEVGSRTPQTFEIANVGVDSYPINSVTMTGEHPNDFELIDLPATTLEPGDRMEIHVAFSPVGEGPRNGTLDVNYSTIAGFGSNAVEAIYYSARTAEESGDTVGAAFEYRRYLAGGNSTDNRARAIIKATFLEEADVYGTGTDFYIYREALNQRDSGDVAGALDSLQALLEDYPDSYLADDSQYMIAYMNLVDLSDYEAAYNGMQTLIETQPDSSYVDTALYSQGLAQSELGNAEAAEAIFTSLKDRHTGIKLDLFEMSYPKDNYLSRLWYEKADEQIELIEDADGEEEEVQIDWSIEDRR